MRVSLSHNSFGYENHLGNNAWMSGCSDLAEVLLFRVPDGHRSVRESSANSKEQIKALNSLPVTAPFKKGQNSNRRAPWQRTLPGLRLPSERQEKESFSSCMHAKQLRPVGKRGGARLHFFFASPFPPCCLQRFLDRNESSAAAVLVEHTLTLSS